MTLLILDGWGVSEEKKGNAILAAHTPNYLDILAHFPQSLLIASGTAVGLPQGLMGNSEVGHLTIGAGRTIVQKLTQISQSISNGSFFQNKVLLKAIENVKANNSALHLLGLLSDGCVHSSLDHLWACLELANSAKLTEVIVHPILDGRDTPPRSAERFLRFLLDKLPQQGHIGVVCGRYYAMDRDKRWERTEKYFRALREGKGLPVASALEAIHLAYAQDVNDEFVLPTIVTQRIIDDGDSVICFNYRPDRVRQISTALTQTNFSAFLRPSLPKIFYACLTEYDPKLNLPVVFDNSQLPSQDIAVTLPELLSRLGIKQFHTAETEKYAHVTYFLNGGKEAPNKGEDRILVPSQKVATYDQAPAMETARVCELACQAILSGNYPFIVLNFANPDMVGHTGSLSAAIKAVESVDVAFGKLLEITKKTKGTLIITADHGNVEQMIDLVTGEPHTAHTSNPVPFIVADFANRINNGNHLANGSLADIAPTILELMKIPQPQEMSGKSLLLP